MEKVQHKDTFDIDADLETILNVILKAGRAECECVFLAHIITKEVDKFFDHLSESHNIKIN